MNENHHRIIMNFVKKGEHFIGVCFLLAGLNILATDGLQGLTRDFVRFLRKLPGVNSVISLVLAGEVKGAMKLLVDSKKKSDDDKDTTKPASTVLPIPERSIAPERVLEIMNKIHSSEQHAEEGKAFAYTYTSNACMSSLTKCLGDGYAKFSEDSGSNSAQHEKLLHDTWRMFMHTNALNPTIYKSLRIFETEIVSMTAWMMHGDTDVSGSLTSGGTESILMAVKCYRDRARKLRPHVTTPNMVVAQTVHPAFMKAAHYFDVATVVVPMTADFRMDVAAAAKAINRDTILLVGSAPQYCHGVVDPIEKLAELALSRGLPLHVDACFGGFMLPWLEKIGEKVPLFDFRVPGVTSISADVHKYGYCSKGASVILYRNAELRSYQYFSYAEWPGGLFVSPSMSGSRPGGMIAAAWAALVAMGQDGYMNLARQLCTATKRICAAADEIPGIAVVTRPDMTCVSLKSSDDADSVNIMSVADVMETRGWKMERQQLPDSLHMSILPQHTSSVVDTLIADLKFAVEEVRSHPELKNEGTAGMYGMIAKIPDRTIVDDFLKNFLSAMYTQQAPADDCLVQQK